MEPEYVYCLKNDKIPNTCKCGGTAKSPQDRCNQISNTSLPVKCELAYFIEVNDWRKGEKYVHDKIIEMGIKRFKGREWFDCNPDDIKSVFDECEKLYRYVKGADKKEINEKITGMKVEKKVIIKKTDNKTVKEVIINKKYYCDLCNFESFDSGNFCRHKQTLKHLENVKNNNNIDLIKKENDELKNTLLLRDMEIKNLKEMLDFYKNHYKS